jgi:mannose-6-phosphate isomerase-like protein (cupin superfamily)
MEPSVLSSTFIVIDPDQRSHAIPVSPSLYPDLDAKFHNFKSCILLAEYSFDADWPSWEMHPAGDEILLLISGAAELQLVQEGKVVTVPFGQVGTTFIVPKGVWHTAKVKEFCRIVFMTPGEGSVHAEQPPL